MAPGIVPSSPRTMSTITPGQQQSISNLLANMTLPTGIGSKESACSIAAINLALTGELTDNIPPCMSAVIGRWIIRAQDAMPAEMRNSSEWKRLLPLAAGTGRDHEQERLAIIMEWMWVEVLPAVQPVADANGFGNEWRVMLRDRTKATADATADAAARAAARAAWAADAAADAAARAAAGAAWAARAADAAHAAHAAWAAWAADAAADAAARAAWAAGAAADAAARAAWAAGAAADAAAGAAAGAADAAADAARAAHAAHAAWAADAAADAAAGAAAGAARAAADAARAADAAWAAAWQQMNPCGLLQRLINL